MAPRSSIATSAQGNSVICQPTNPWEGLRAISRLRVQARLAATTLGALVLIAPSALLGQGFDPRLSAPPNGPAEALGRAGVSALTPPRAPIGSTTPVVDSDLVPRDTSGHHGSRAHHVAVGAMIGGATGLLFGLVVDRMWFGSSDGRGHFHNLWLVTVPLGAGIGALIGMVPQAD